MADTGLATNLALIAQSARRGRLDEAAALAETALAAGDRDPVMLALAGAVQLKRGSYDRAVDCLRDAHRLCPDDSAVRANLVEALYRSEQHEGALRLCNEDSARADRSLRIARLGGHLAQEAQDFDLAERLYGLVVAADPTDWSVWNNLGNTLSARGDFSGAADALGKAAALVPDSPPVQLNYGNVLVDAGRVDEGEAVLKSAAARFVNDSSPLLALFTIYIAQGREDEAYDAIRGAARRAPDVADVQSDWGQEAARRNLYEEAEGAFENALTLKADLGPAFVGLASVYERTNRDAALDPLHGRALANGVDSQSVAYIDALRFKRANAFEDAFDALERAGDVVVPGRRLHLRGIMLDRLGRYDEAFAAFDEMNIFWRSDPSQPQDRARAYRNEIAGATKTLSRNWVDGWVPANDIIDHDEPVFLVGFPRSGTTLLDTMLMSDPRVRVLEEEPFLAKAEQDLGGIENLAKVDADTLNRVRQKYFERAAEIVDFQPDTILVDKHPMHLAKVAVARRLFPTAKFLLALRHPCDVILSCFLTNFRINNAMANFLDLADAAELYDLTFRNWQASLECFDLSVATVVYERLIEDPERELRPAFKMLGLQFPEGSLDHRPAARARGAIRTASYAQVTEPIYKRASGRWQRYAEHLLPIFPTIKPWVEHFGYSLHDDRIPAWPDRVEGR